MKIVPYWRSGWRLSTVHVGTVAMVFGMLPPDQQASILELLHISPSRMPAVLGVIFIISRMTSQPSVEGASK